MAEGTTDEINDIDILVSRFDKWTKEIKGDENGLLMLKYLAQEELCCVSKILSDNLPPLNDKSLFNIDHVLYPEENWSDYETRQPVLYAKELFERIDMGIYLTSYYLEVKESDKKNMLIDYTLLKVVQHLPKYEYNLGNISRRLLDSGNEKLVCFGLKLFKTVLEGKFAKRLQTRELCSLVSTYRNIPTEAIKDSNKKQIALFISNLANGCYEKFDNEYKDPDMTSLSSERKIVDVMHYILYDFNFDMPLYQLNILYNELTSAKDEETKHICLKWLVRAIATSCRRSLFEGFKILTNCLLSNVVKSGSDNKDNIMRLIDIDYGREIEPYLPGVDVPIESKKLWNDEKNEDETDYTFEKFFFYDVVMKNLNLLKIFYTAASECNNGICEDDNDYTEAFSDDELILKDIGCYLINKDERVPWYLEKTLEMCPFIIFPLEQKDLVFDLIRVLRREEFIQSKKLSRKIKQMEGCYVNRWNKGRLATHQEF